MTSIKQIARRAIRRAAEARKRGAMTPRLSRHIQSAIDRADTYRRTSNTKRKKP
jgi:methionine aminopeptidase